MTMIIRLRKAGNATFAEIAPILTNRQKAQRFTQSLKDAKFNALPKKERLTAFYKLARNIVKEDE